MKPLMFRFPFTEEKLSCDQCLEAIITVIEMDGDAEAKLAFIKNHLLQRTLAEKVSPEKPGSGTNR